LQVIDDASRLENEVDQAKFFTKYPMVNHSLEESFLSLLLLLENWSNADVYLQESGLVDLTEMVEAIKAIALKKKCGKESCTVILVTFFFRFSQ